MVRLRIGGGVYTTIGDYEALIFLNVAAIQNKVINNDLQLLARVA